MSEILWVGVGGFFGAILRLLLNTWVSGFGAGLPLGTIVVNVTGSLAIGLSFTLLGGRLVQDPVWRLLAMTGFLGGYTTFSSYTLEAYGLAVGGEWLKAAVYVLANNILGLVAVASGAAIGRTITP